MNISVADPGSRIPDLGSKTSNKRERRKKLRCQTFLCSHKIWAIFQRIIEVFTKKIVKKLFKIWSWDLGSEIREKHIPDPGSMGKKSRVSDPDPYPDPDPYWIRIQSDHWIRIRIRNLNTDPDPDPGGQK